MRDRMASDPLIARYLSVLEQDELIPEAFRRSGFERYAHSRELGAVERAFAEDEFVLDPTRLTLYTALTGKNGFEFRSQVLMQQLGVQVNHTSINTVLMNATIGVTWGALSFLLDGFRREAARWTSSWRAPAATSGGCSRRRSAPSPPSCRRCRTSAAFTPRSAPPRSATAICGRRSSSPSTRARPSTCR